MHIAFFEVMPGEREALETQLAPEHTIHWYEERLTPTTIAQAQGAEIISIFVHSDITQSIIDQLPDCKLIVTRSMGYDHIDVDYARTKGIRVINVTTYASHPVAEFAFALMLAVSRRTSYAYNQLREGGDEDIRNLKGINLFGKMLGVVGTGRIGKNVIAIAKGFGMRVIASDTKPDTAFAAEQGFSYVPLQNLVATADVITLHAPYLKETHHLINAELFAHMKKGCIIVNTARGELMDTAALVVALRDGTVWGAGLDVLEKNETLNRVLIDMPNVVVTPHIAFETEEAMAEISRATAQSIQNFVSGTEQAYL